MSPPMSRDTGLNDMKINYSFVRRATKGFETAGYHVLFT
jgi:hypothetical protein